MSKTETPEETPELKDQRATPVAANLPVALPHAEGLPEIIPGTWSKRRLRTSALMLGLVGVGIAVGLYWWTHRQPLLPPGIAYGNGRLEADPIDIATKFAGRIFQLRVDEGDMVTAGQVVAVMDTRDLAASLKKAEAHGRAGAQGRERGQRQYRPGPQPSDVRQPGDGARPQARRAGHGRRARPSISAGSSSTARKAAEMRCQGESRSRPSMRSTQRRMTSSSTRSTSPTTRSSRRAMAASNTALPTSGEVLPAGGKVFTMLDIAYVYMDIYLPTAGGRPRQDRQRRAHRARRLSRPADPGEGELHREPGAVHAEDGRDADRARQADVPHPRAHRSRTLSRARRCGAQRPAGRRLREVRSADRLAGATARASREHGGTRASPVVRLEGLTHRYAAMSARSTTSRLDIPAGCIVGLIGPDGVGKSSLLGHHRRRQAHSDRLASRCWAATWRTRATARPSARASPTCRRGSARTSMPTSASRENIEFFARLFGQDRAERDARIAEPAGQHGPDAVRRPPGASNLSGGMRQKLGLCCSLIHDPDLLDPRRADDRRRSAVAPPVLGADRRACARAGRA